MCVESKALRLCVHTHTQRSGKLAGEESLTAQAGWLSWVDMLCLFVSYSALHRKLRRGEKQAFLPHRQEVTNKPPAPHTKRQRRITQKKKKKYCRIIQNRDILGNGFPTWRKDTQHQPTWNTKPHDVCVWWVKKKKHVDHDAWITRLCQLYAFSQHAAQ